MKIVQRDIIEVRIEEDAEIYVPPPRIVRGEINGKEFSILIEESDLPPGTQPGPPQNVDVVAWDQKFYVSWEAPDGVAEYYTVEIEDDNDEIAAEGQFETDTFDATFDNQVTSWITNGTQYAAIVSATFQDITNSASEITFTPSDKTVQNLAKSNATSSSVDLDWDTVSGDVLAYKIVFEDDSDNILFTRESDTNSFTVESIPRGFYTIYIKAISEKRVFEGDKSNEVQFYFSQKIEDLSAEFIGGVDNVEFSWTGTDFADGYDLYYREEGGTFSKYNSSLLTSTTQTITAEAFGNGVFEFKVVPVKSGFSGIDSNIASTEIDIPIFTVTKSDMNETITTQVFDGSDVVFTVDETDMNESTSTS